MERDKAELFLMEVRRQGSAVGENVYLLYSFLRMADKESFLFVKDQPGKDTTPSQFGITTGQ